MEGRVGMTLETMKDGEARAGMGSGLFPVIYSTLAADAVRVQVAQAYPIDRPSTCQLLRRGLHDTYLLTTHGSRYIARVYRARRRTPSDIAYELELLTHLAARGVSVSVPIAARDGGLSYPLIAPEGPRQLALFTYAKGTPLSWEKEEHSYLAGKLAGCDPCGVGGLCEPAHTFLPGPGISD